MGAWLDQQWLLLFNKTTLYNPYSNNTFSTSETQVKQINYR